MFLCLRIRAQWSEMDLSKIYYLLSGHLSIHYTDNKTLSSLLIADTLALYHVNLLLIIGISYKPMFCKNQLNLSISLFPLPIKLTSLLSVDLLTAFKSPTAHQKLLLRLILFKINSSHMAFFSLKSQGE